MKTCSCIWNGLALICMRTASLSWYVARTMVPPHVRPQFADSLAIFRWLLTSLTQVGLCLAEPNEQELNLPEGSFRAHPLGGPR